MIYRENRDLDHLSVEQLHERIVDSINNQTVLAGLGEVGLVNPKEAGDYWIRIFTEVLEEWELRRFSYPFPLDPEQLREAMFNPTTSVPDVEAVIGKHGLSSKPYLLKFGEPHWLAEAHLFGRFRISPASFYYSVDHNHARQDQELSRKLLPHPQNSTVHQYLDRIGKTPVDGQYCSEIEIKNPTNYYVFSMSMKYSARLFSDFNSTACLVVFDPLVFLKRFGIETSEKLGGSWSHTIGPVHYFDPVRGDPSLVRVCNCKPFKHAYQFEMRMTWSPPEPSDTLEPFYVEVGSLEDCAELVTLDTHPPVP